MMITVLLKGLVVWGGILALPIAGFQCSQNRRAVQQVEADIIQLGVAEFCHQVEPGVGRIFDRDSEPVCGGGNAQGGFAIRLAAPAGVWQCQHVLEGGGRIRIFPVLELAGNGLFGADDNGWRIGIGGLAAQNEQYNQDRATCVLQVHQKPTSLANSDIVYCYVYPVSLAMLGREGSATCGF